MGNSKTYEAFVLRKKMMGQEFPTVDEIVKDKILLSDGELKKEEIDEAVCKVIGKNMGVPMQLDESIVGQTSSALKKLERENIIKHSAYGYWVKR